MSDEGVLTVRLQKSNGRLFQVQHDGGSPGRWAVVEKPELQVLAEEARLWQLHCKDIQQAHKGGASLSDDEVEARRRKIRG